MSEQRRHNNQRQQQSVQQQEAALHLTKSQVLAMGGSLLTTVGVELATHNPEWIAAGILATIAAGKLTPVFMETMMGAFVPVDPDEVLDATARVVQAIPLEDTSHLPQDPISKIKRLLHIKSPSDEQGQPKDERPVDFPEKAEPAPSNKQQQGNPLENWIPPQFALDGVLDVVRAFNKKGLVYFGESADGAIAIDLADMYHVIDVSSSGKGKSNRFRLAMMQMVKYCETYYINPLAANVKAVKDRREIEVWKPIYDRLANKRPMKEGPEIKQLMTALVEEIKRRNEREEQGDFSWQMEPIFVFIDELPEVFDRCPEAIKMLDKIGRAGRQFSVFCWVASQTANVNEIGQSAAAQANYKTRIYGGGDKTSSERMMKGSLPKDTERTLQSSGAGLTLMLADGIEGLAFVRAPLVTNEALFDYLDIGPFRKGDWIKSRPAPLSFSSQRQVARPFYAQYEGVKASENENENEMKEPVEPRENPESLRERDESFIASHEDETAIFMAVIDLQNTGQKVTREAIKQKLGWNNAKHAVLKAVCDKHNIAMR